MELRRTLQKLGIDGDFIKVGLKISEDTDKSVFVLDGTKMVGKDNMLREVYRKLDLDNYVDYANLDGLEDLLQPDQWSELMGMKIRLFAAQTVFQKNEEQDIRNLFSLFADVSSSWKKEGKVFLLELYP